MCCGFLEHVGSRPARRRRTYRAAQALEASVRWRSPHEIHRLEIQAFGPFADREVVDFDLLGAQGLFLLNGPTGAGKTSVLDAICYALFGAVPGARRDGRRLRSDHAAAGREPKLPASSASARAASRCP